MNDPRWKGFPSQCDNIQRSSCARVSGDFSNPITTCPTCLFNSDVPQKYSVDFLQASVSSSELLTQISKCISYL